MSRRDARLALVAAAVVGLALLTVFAIELSNTQAKSRADVEGLLQRYLGVTTVIWLGKGVYLDETGGRYVHVLADGDIHTSGDLAKAIACGADAVVLGTPLAESAEALGDGWFWPTAAAHPSLPRGALLQVAVGERLPLSQVLNGPSDDPFGSLNLVGGLRRSMAKSGYCDLKEFQKVGLTVGS